MNHATKSVKMQPAITSMRDAPYCRVWPVTLQRRLPPIPVPLNEPDPDLTLDLQPLIDGIYTLGRYDERIDYTRRLTPALPQAEAAWVRTLLKDRPTPARIVVLGLTSYARPRRGPKPLWKLFSGCRSP